MIILLVVVAFDCQTAAIAGRRACQSVSALIGVGRLQHRGPRRTPADLPARSQRSDEAAGMLIEAGEIVERLVLVEMRAPPARLPAGLVDIGGRERRQQCGCWAFTKRSTWLNTSLGERPQDRAAPLSAST